jgi:hypothetical protein
MSSKTPWGVLRLTVVFATVALVATATATAQTGPPAPNAVATALAYLQANPGTVGATPESIAELAVTSAYRSTHNGVTHVNIQQQFQGMPVGGAHATVNVAGDGDIVFVGGVFQATLEEDEDDLELDAVDAVEAAADELGLDEPERLRVLELSVGNAQESLISDGGISERPIPASLLWHAGNGGLRLAWQLEIADASDIHYWDATIDAATGDLLGVQDLTIEDEQDELAGTLSRDASLSAAATSATDAGTNDPVIDGSSYEVYEITKESPNDGDRTIVENPADANASPFGWHDTDAAVGPEYTITRGNNVHAYLDQDNNGAADFGGSPDGGGGLDFHFPIDLTEHAQAYRDAVVTNLFYWNNVIHDLTYNYGFTEDAGNFQENNYDAGEDAGNGDGDYVRAEAADGGGTNNANFNTGLSRMQMYLWPGSTNAFGFQNEVVVDNVGSFIASWSRFGPPAMNAGTSGQIVLVNDGSALPTEGCGPLVGFPAGAIALVDRGTCTFLEKVESAEAAGASAVIIANNTGGNPPVLTGSMVNEPPAIPAVSVTQTDGATIKAALPASGTVRKDPDHPGIRDGDVENGIIIHEYGHGISIRTTGGPVVSCLSGNEQAGEGWSDYLAISMLMDTALDDPEGPRGMGPYALFQDSRQGNGIRPRPYSRNWEIQPFSYDSIKSNGWLNGASLALPHGLGHGWAATLWDVTWELVDKHGFNANIYDAWDAGGNNRAFQYVMDGLKLQGCAPTLLRSARAVIAGAGALDGGEDYCTVSAAFARRGFGWSAVDGTTNRNDNDEAFDIDPACRRGFLAPASHAYGTLRTVEAGDAVALRFNAPEVASRGLDILAENNPYSRLVDCDTLRTVDTSQTTITPRPAPVPTETPGASTLTKVGSTYHYNWLTEEDWAGTCREVVVTRWDGNQHRAFFRFVNES